MIRTKRTGVRLGPQRLGLAGTWEWIGAPSTVTGSNYYSTFNYVNAWDGNPNTGWNTNTTSPAWTTADFGTAVAAKRMELLSASVARTWDLSGSDDNSSWTAIFQGVSAPTGTPGVLEFSNLQTWRYWKMYASDGAWTDPLSFNLQRFV